MLEHCVRRLGRTIGKCSARHTPNNSNEPSDHTTPMAKAKNQGKKLECICLRVWNCNPLPAFVKPLPPPPLSTLSLTLTPPPPPVPSPLYTLFNPHSSTSPCSPPLSALSLTLTPPPPPVPSPLYTLFNPHSSTSPCSPPSLPFLTHSRPRMGETNLGGTGSGPSSDIISSRWEGL